MAVNKTISMVNIGEEPITIRLGGAPGDGVTEYEIKPGESQAFHENLCKPVPGAGRDELPPILERKSMRTFADGVRRPILVQASQAKDRKASYAKQIEAWKKAGSPAPKTPPMEAPAH